MSEAVGPGNLMTSPQPDALFTDMANEPESECAIGPSTAVLTLRRFQLPAVTSPASLK